MSNIPLFFETENGEAVAIPMMRLGWGEPEAYDPAKTYKRRDCVQFQNAVYLVVNPNGVTGVTPVDGEDYKQLTWQGVKGEDNAVWYTGTAVTGQGSGIIAGVAGSKAGDMYLNSQSSDLYTAAAPDTWDWVMNLAQSVNVTATDVPTDEVDGDGNALSVQEVLDEHDAAIADLDASKLNASANAASASKLQTARTVQTNLASTDAVSFNGTANIAPGVKGKLPLVNGGTNATLSGITPNAVIRADGTAAESLWFTSTSNGAAYATSDNGLMRFGTLPIAQGGTGGKTAAAARNSLGLQNGATTRFLSGTVSVTIPTGSNVGSEEITFSSAFDGIPMVRITMNTSTPQNRSASAVATATGVKICVGYTSNVSNALTTSIKWTAIGN